MRKTILKRTLFSVLALAIGVSLLSPLNSTVVRASEQHSYETDIDMWTVQTKPTTEQLQSLGLSLEEIAQIESYLDANDSGVIVRNGFVYNVNGLPFAGHDDLDTYGVKSWAVRLVMKAINKIPSKVRRWLIALTPIWSFLSVFEHMTGSIEYALYHACIWFGAPDWLAWTIAKTITFFIG